MAVQKLKASARVPRAAHLGARLEKSLCSYAAAAAASGVSLLASAPSAEARIVYTPADTTIPRNGAPVLLDLNHDGIADFSFSNRGLIYLGWLVADAKDQGNAIWGRGNLSGGDFKNGPPKGTYTGVFASALFAGFAVKPNKSHFQKGPQWLMTFDGTGPSTSVTFGQWRQTKGRYLGLKFMIDGQVHYGWARLNVSAQRPITATLTGYAYETIPNKPIITGKTKGPDVITLEPATTRAIGARRIRNFGLAGKEIAGRHGKTAPHRIALKNEF